MLEAGAKLPDVGAEDDAGTPVHLRDLGKKRSISIRRPTRPDAPTRRSSFATCTSSSRRRVRPSSG